MGVGRRGARLRAQLQHERLRRHGSARCVGERGRERRRVVVVAGGRARVRRRGRNGQRHDSRRRGPGVVRVAGEERARRCRRTHGRRHGARRDTGRVRRRGAGRRAEVQRQRAARDRHDAVLEERRRESEGRAVRRSGHGAGRLLGGHGEPGRGARARVVVVAEEARDDGPGAGSLGDDDVAGRVAGCIRRRGARLRAEGERDGLPGHAVAREVGQRRRERRVVVEVGCRWCRRPPAG